MKIRVILSSHTQGIVYWMDTFLQFFIPCFILYIVSLICDGDDINDSTVMRLDHFFVEVRGIIFFLILKTEIGRQLPFSGNLL